MRYFNKRSCITWWQFRREERLKDSTASRLGCLGPSHTRCIVIDEQKESSLQRQFAQSSLFFFDSPPYKIHYEHFSVVGRACSWPHLLLSLLVVTNLMMIIWLILIIFYFKGHICSRLISVSWKLHLQMFNSHTEALSFMETSGF